MFKKILWIAAFTFSLMFGQSVLAHDKDYCKDRIQSMIKSLNLSEEQKDKVKPILEQLKTSMKDNWSQVKDIKTQLKQQIESATMDEATVDSLIDKKAALIANSMKAKAKAKNQIYNILTDDQKTSYQKMVKEKAEKMEKKWKKCHDDD